MTKRKIYRQDEFKVTEMKIPGAKFAGQYLFSRPVKSEYGDTSAHYFLSKSGEPFFVWGSSELNFFMAQLEKGEFVAVTYIGKETMNPNPAGAYGVCYIKRYEIEPIPQPSKKKGWLR